MKTGIRLLFAGPAGTGKKRLANVIAAEHGLDLCRFDLRDVVSEYIGETEKNLKDIVKAAAVTETILFFDEADALFGKRSEVKDAHDRYANIEVACFLARLEEHQGMAILAANLRRDIDQAFIRRFHCVVEFPIPDSELRESLWRKALEEISSLQ